MGEVGILNVGAGDTKLVFDRPAPSDLIIRKNPSVDLSGQTFGRLTVIKYLGFSKKNWRGYWACKCSCGRTVPVRSQVITRKINPTLSCGCLSSERASARQWKGVGEIGKQHFQRIFNRARSSGIPFDLTIEQMWAIFKKQNCKCALSGITLTFGRHRSVERMFGHWPRLGSASLDRIDSAKGYVIDNVQWVHKDINKMKGVLSQDDFITLCCAVSIQHPPYRPEAGL